jgi:hypothetical protein
MRAGVRALQAVGDRFQTIGVEVVDEETLFGRAERTLEFDEDFLRLMTDLGARGRPCERMSRGERERERCYGNTVGVSPKPVYVRPCQALADRLRYPPGCSR